MNILYEKLPDTICIDSTEYSVHTDFRNWVEVEVLLSGELSADKLARAISLCYKKLPTDLKSAVSGMIRFHSQNTERKKGKRGHTKPVYSFEYDSGYIYSAFMEKYGIDLSKENMHWYCFCALLKGLGECRFTKIMQYRSLELGKIKNAEQKSFYRKMKRLYALPEENIAIAESIGDLF